MDKTSGILCDQSTFSMHVKDVLEVLSMQLRDRSQHFWNILQLLRLLQIGADSGSGSLLWLFSKEAPNFGVKRRSLLGRSLKVLGEDCLVINVRCLRCVLLKLFILIRKLS